MVKKVLCVEDDPTALMYCQIMVRKSLFAGEVITAVNGEEALGYYERLTDAADEAPPELILLDLNMPVMDGWQFLDEFMEKFAGVFPETRIAILSSSVNPEDRQKACMYGPVMGFIDKPLSIKSLERIKKDL